MARKPSDKWAVPMCRTDFTNHRQGCHAQQHPMGEDTFWSLHGDPLPLAEHLWRVSGDMKAGLRAVERFRQRLAL